MKTNFLFDKTMTTLERSLNLRSMNQKLIVSNIANMDTPNYKAFKMMVDEKMQDTSNTKPHLSMTRTQVGHLDIKGNATDLGRVERVENNPHTLRGDFLCLLPGGFLNLAARALSFMKERLYNKKR